MADAQQPSGVSRRRALFTGAGLVAAGVVAGAAGGVATTSLLAGGTLAGGADEVKVPVMVHLRDARTGTFDVFFGATKVEMVDASFAAKLSNAAANIPLES